MIDDLMEIPPHWIAVQYAIADQDGLVPAQEREVFLHFCSQNCIVDYSKGNTLKERICTVDRKYDDDLDDDEELGDVNE